MILQSYIPEWLCPLPAGRADCPASPWRVWRPLGWCYRCPPCCYPEVVIRYLTLWILSICPHLADECCWPVASVGGADLGNVEAADTRLWLVEAARVLTNQRRPGHAPGLITPGPSAGQSSVAREFLERIWVTLLPINLSKLGTTLSLLCSWLLSLTHLQKSKMYQNEIGPVCLEN